jgi:hypothetical protein
LNEAGSYAKVDLGAVYSLDNIGIWARSDSFWSESTGIRVFSSLTDVSSSYTTLQNSIDVAEAAFANEIAFIQNQSYSINSTNQGGWNKDGANIAPDAWADASVTSNPTGVTQTITNGSLVVGSSAPVIGGRLSFSLPDGFKLAVMVNGVNQGNAVIDQSGVWTFDLNGKTILSNTSNNTVKLVVLDTQGTEYTSITQTVEFVDVGTSVNDAAPAIDASTTIYSTGVYFKASLTDHLSLGAVVKVFLDDVEVGYLQDTGTPSRTISGWIDADIPPGNHVLTARVDNLISGELGTLSADKVLTTHAPDAAIDHLVVDHAGVVEVYDDVTDPSLGDVSPEVVIDISQYTAGDNYFLVIDGTPVDIADPSAAEQVAGQLTRATDVVARDATQNGSVNIAVKVVHADGSFVVSDDLTYLYQQ